MASIVTRRNGSREILVICPDGKRRPIRLGHVTKAQAAEVKRHVEHLVNLRLHGSALPPSTAEWLSNIPHRLLSRLIVCGLATASTRATVPTLGQWLEQYITGRADVKPRTRINFDAARNDLLKHFGGDTLMADITRGDVDDFIVWMRTERGLSEGTARRRGKRCKQFFAAAIKRRLLTENPFDGIKCSTFAEDRFHFVTQADALAVLEACPDAEWRLIFGLARWGGLRVPSELMLLTWDDIDFDRGRFTIHSPKTAGHDGKGSRVAPIFPELEPLFPDAFEAAADGAQYVIARHRDSNANLRTQLVRIIKRAGVEVWDKVFTNLRATRASELVEIFPAHVSAAWLGHSMEIARKHYLMTTDEHFAKATGKAAQKAAQQEREMSEMPCNGHQENGAKPDLQSPAKDFAPLTYIKVPPRGLEPLSHG